ncbi:MAG TPA: class I SAM-dependent methyltransferase [Polyangia bacterium]|nr:class I SAM-dependent methyltransferase [Polyangia bacterium]
MSIPAADDAARRSRESAFHDQSAEAIDLDSVLVDQTFTAVTAVENQYVLSQFGDVRGKRVLDYGSGLSEGGIYLAKLGADVVSVDVSAKMLASAQVLAGRHGVKLETRLVTGETLPAETDEFDLVYGNGVLHHVPLETAVPELVRVMRREARGCFIEPLPDNPLINVYRKMANRVRTVDERPLTEADREGLRRHFGAVAHREFWLTTLAVFLKFYLIERVHPNDQKYWKKIYSDADRLAGLFAPLSRLDERVLARFPRLGRYCWTTVITVDRPLKTRETTAR